MKKVLVFCAGGQGAQEGLQLEEAIAQYKNGNEVTFLYCDETIGGCNDNRNFNKTKCSVCKYFQKNHRKKYLPKGIKQISIGKIVDERILAESEIKYSYDSIDSLRKIKFHDIEIGLGAISSYITYTRNLDPKINDTSRLYFDKLLRSQIIMTLGIEHILNENKFDLFIVHNGRFAIYKPLLNIAQRNNIDYICTESFKDANGNVSKDYYYNDIPHNIGPRNAKYLKAWDNAKKRGIDCEEIGKSFYERRRNAEGTGDKIYIAAQEKGRFIENWDETKENIVIFNSSEDEFCAVSGDFEKGRIFPTQIDGIKAILEHYKNDISKHFYLRVHPNLIPVKYSYHLDLYKLDYPNLTVIPADSKISSYALLDKADKVITFGSTMGIEATYAHKPSICIGVSFYERLNVAYHPKTIDEVWQYIDNSTLQHLFNVNVLIYGYYLMGIYNSIIHDDFKYVDSRLLSYKILGKDRLVRAYEKIFGSHRIYLAVRCILNSLCDMNVPSQENAE